MFDLNNFCKEYNDSGKLTFENIKYRQGARITCSFGIDEGYTIDEKGDIIFDSIRIHTGVDRSGVYGKNGQKITNVVYSPFNFNRSNAIYYGPKISYGYLIQLINDDYDFEMRIGHMNPEEDLIHDVKELLYHNQAIKRDTILGKAGNFGISGGAHTHTEFISQEQYCRAFEEILSSKYGKSVENQYLDDDVVLSYKKIAKWSLKSKEDILLDFENLKKDRGIIFINKYKYQYYDPSSKKYRTRYSSEHLFNGL